MMQSQYIDQATRHASHLERLKSHEVAAILALLQRIQDELTGMLARSDLTEWSRARLERQLAFFREILERGYSESIIPAIDKAVAELAQYEAQFEQKSLSAVAVYDFALPASAQILAAVRVNPLSVVGPDNGKLLDAFVKDWTDDQITLTVNTIRSGFAQGKTTPQIVRQISSETNLQVSRHLEMLTRTALQHTANMARESVWQANESVIESVEWVSVLDSRTSAQCRTLDGQIFPINKGPRPPIHIGCRSAVVAVLKDSLKFLQEGETRASRDPQTGKVESVPATKTYYDWLKGQPAEVQDSIIGKTRGALLRRGGLTSQRFAELQLGKNFKPLPLYAPKGQPSVYALDPVAFMRAGIDVPKTVDSR